MNARECNETLLAIDNVVDPFALICDYAPDGFRWPAASVKHPKVFHKLPHEMFRPNGRPLKLSFAFGLILGTPLPIHRSELILSIELTGGKAQWIDRIN